MSGLYAAVVLLSSVVWSLGDTEVSLVLGGMSETCSAACTNAGLHCTIESLKAGDVTSADDIKASAADSDAKCWVAFESGSAAAPYRNVFHMCFFGKEHSEYDCDASLRFHRRFCGAVPETSSSLTTTMATATSTAFESTTTTTTTSKDGACSLAKDGIFGDVSPLSATNVSSPEECCALCGEDCAHVSYGQYHGNNLLACFRHSSLQVPLASRLRVTSCPSFLVACRNAGARADELPEQVRWPAMAWAAMACGVLLTLSCCGLTLRATHWPDVCCKLSCCWKFSRRFATSGSMSLVNPDESLWQDVEWLVEVRVVKEHRDQKIGMGITGNRVTSLQSGSVIEKWNSDHPDKKVSLHSVVLEVNGKRDRHLLKDEIKHAEGLLNMTIWVGSRENSNSSRTN